MEITTKNEARARGEKNFFTGVPCKNGHTALRSVANGSCRKCLSENVRKWRGDNAELDREKCRKWYAANKEHANAWKRNWIVENRDTYLARRKSYRMKPTNRAKEMLNTSRWKARQKGFEHNLTLEWIMERIDKGACEITGIPFDLEPLPNGRQNPYTASLDRIDCSIGYVEGNVRMILWGLNAAFNTYGEEVYADIAQVYLKKKGLT